MISSILSILDPSFEVVLDTVFSKSFECNSLAQIRLWGKRRADIGLFQVWTAPG